MKISVINNNSQSKMTTFGSFYLEKGKNGKEALKIIKQHTKLFKDGLFNKKYIPENELLKGIDLSRMETADFYCFLLDNASLVRLSDVKGKSGKEIKSIIELSVSIVNKKIDELASKAMKTQVNAKIRAVGRDLRR